MHSQYDGDEWAYGYTSSWCENRMTPGFYRGTKQWGKEFAAHKQCGKIANWKRVHKNNYTTLKVPSFLCEDCFVSLQAAENLPLAGQVALISMDSVLATLDNLLSMSV